MTRTGRSTALPPPAPGSSRRRGERGFTFIEALVALLISVEVIVAGLALFDFHNKLARVQAQVSDMQQSLRIAQYEMVHLAREAGRGGFPPVLRSGTINEAWGAAAVRNNVDGTNDHIALGNSASPLVVHGTDVLTLRGVFSTPIFEINKTAASLVLTPAGSTPANATGGAVVVCATSSSQTAQDLTPLNTAGSNVINNEPQCPSPPGVANPNGVLIAFNVTGDATAQSFQQLGATPSTIGLPPGMRAVAWLGILEEYRYYVRQDYAVPGDTTSDPAPHLSRARMYPGTETPYFNDAANLQVDVADNVLDLQVALGVDINGTGQITDGNPPGAPSTTDGWIFNVAGDAQFPTVPPPPLRELRITTLAKTGKNDFQYQGPALTNIEDHVYTATDFPNTPRGRSYRHRLLQTVVGLRNL
jgi:hypothetical protein